MQPDTNPTLYAEIESAAIKLGVFEKIKKKLDEINVQYTSGDSYYSHSTNVAYISRSSASTPRELLRTFVHEFEHSQQEWLNSLAVHYLMEGNFELSSYYYSLREAYAAAAEIILFGDVHSSDWFGYVSVPQAQAALNLVNGYGSMNEGSFKTNLALALFESFKGNEAYSNYESRLIKHYTDYWRDGFLNSDNVVIKQSDLPSSSSFIRGTNIKDVFSNSSEGGFTWARKYYTDNSLQQVGFEIIYSRDQFGRSFESIIDYGVDGLECKFISRELDEGDSGSINSPTKYWTDDDLAFLASLPYEYRVATGYSIPFGEPFPGIDDYQPSLPVVVEAEVQALTIDFFNLYSSVSHSHYVDVNSMENAFDWDGSGAGNPTNWIGAGEAFLVDAEATYSGSVSPTSIVYNLYQLALEDSNGDGVFSAADAAWSDYRVWFGHSTWIPESQRRIADGLFSFEELGIASIDLTGSATSQRDAWGNLYDTTIKLFNGESMTIRSSSFSYMQGSFY